jgi:tetratricopeptide (TPR) repeat protein
MRRKAALLGVLFYALFARHSLVFSQQSGSIVDRAYKNDVLQKIAGLVESKYVLADKAKGYADEFKAKCASGAYNSLTEAKEFAEKVTADLIAITHDKHLNFRVMVPSDVGEKASGSLHHPVRYFRLRAKENAGFYKLEWIEPRVGYVDLRRFYSFDQAKDMAVAAMKFLANAQAIIIDVRENGGGSGDYLSSYFLPYPTQLSGSFSRQTGSLTESWTRRDIGMEPRLDVPLFILTGPNTFSASEAFAYDMQSWKRAILIGEPTKGGAHSVDVFGIDDQFEFYISTERAISPVTGGNWEGTGVIPDIRVPAASAVDAAVVEAKKAAAAYGLGKDAGLKKAVEEMQTLADNAAGLYREGKNQAADAALDSLFNIARRAGMISEFFVYVFAYNFLQSPQDEQMGFAILKKSIEFFPESFTACELLASVYSSKGNKELALRYFRKVLELDPGNRNAAKMIKELGGLPNAPGGNEFGQIERSIRDCIGWAKTKDFRLLYSIIANDADFLEVHPDGAVVKGFEDFKKAETFWGSPDFKAVRYEVRDLKIKLSKSGDVAWFFCILDDINEWKGQPANWENTRWTGILEKRDDRWVIVQQHFSFAAKD